MAGEKSTRRVGRPAKNDRDKRFPVSVTLHSETIQMLDRMAAESEAKNLSQIVEQMLLEAAGLRQPVGWVPPQYPTNDRASVARKEFIRVNDRTGKLVPQK